MILPDDGATVGDRLMGIEFQCDRCWSMIYVNDGPVAYYTLADGRAFFGPHRTGWCSCCRLLSEVEDIPDPEVLEQRLAELRQSPANEAAKDMLEHWITLLDWSRMRKEPPRCLRCGGLNFIPLNQAGDCLVEMGENGPRPFRHPNCGGVFKVKEVAFAQPIGKCLTADGQRLDHRWDGPFVRWVRRLSCWVAGRFG